MLLRSLSVCFVFSDLFSYEAVKWMHLFVILVKGFLSFINIFLFVFSLGWNYSSYLLYRFLVCGALLCCAKPWTVCENSLFYSWTVLSVSILPIYSHQFRVIVLCGVVSAHFYSSGIGPASFYMLALSPIGDDGNIFLSRNAFFIFSINWRHNTFFLSLFGYALDSFVPMRPPLLILSLLRSASII